MFKEDDVLEDILISLSVNFKIADGKATEIAVRFEPMVPDIIFKK